MRIHYFQHVPFEDPAAILQWADVRGGHTISHTKFYEDQAPPDVDSYDLLLVMGGPMSVHDTDEHHWLEAEKRHIRDALDAGRKMLGVCLGAQLIAEALGGTVEPNDEKEIGWFEVTRTDAAADCPVFSLLPERFTAFHWHGERFTIPPDCRHLAASDACANQAFSYQDRAFGLQFHVESTAQSVQKLIEHCRDEVDAGGPNVQTAEQMTGAQTELSELSALITAVMDGIDRL